MLLNAFINKNTERKMFECDCCLIHGKSVKMDVALPNIRLDTPYTTNIHE